MNQHQEKVFEKIKEISQAPSVTPKNPSELLQTVAELTFDGVALMQAIKVAITNDIKNKRSLNVEDVIRAIDVAHTAGILKVMLHDMNDKEIMEELVNEVE